MIVVDAPPLIYLSKTGQLQLLKALYGKLVLPQGVWDEVVTHGKGRPGASEVEKGRGEGWIIVQKVQLDKSLEVEGATGADAEVIMLAMRMKISLVSNDRIIATIAKAHGIRVVWLTRVIIEAAKQNVLTKAQARTLLRDLVRAGLRVKSDVLAELFHTIEA